MLGTPVTYAYAIDLLRSSVIILSFGVFFFSLHSKPTNRYIAEISLGFYYVYISESSRERGGSQRGRERKIGYFKGYLWVGKFYVSRLPKYPALLLKISKYPRTAVYQLSPIVKLDIDKFNCTPSIPLSSKRLSPWFCSFQSHCRHVPQKNSFCMTYQSAINAPQVLNWKLEVGHRHSLGPDCNKMPCLTLYLADMVFFPPMLKPGSKMVQNKQFAVIRYFPYTTERIHTPYLYHQESRKISHSTLTASCYS